MFKLTFQPIVVTLFLWVVLMKYNPTLALTCSSATLTDDLGPFYLASSPQTTLIAPTNELSNNTKRLVVRGRMLSTISCTNAKYYPVSKVNIEVWYAGRPDSQGNYYQTNKYRGQLVTDACGYYTFVQSFPVLYPQRPILHTHIRLSDTSGNLLLVTQMYFKGSATGYYNDKTIASVLNGVRHDLQAVTVKTLADGSRRVRLDVFLNKAGNTKCTRVSP